MKKKHILHLVMVAVLLFCSSVLSAFRWQSPGDNRPGGSDVTRWTKEQYQEWLETARYPDWRDYENPAEFRQATNDYFWSIQQAYPEADICCAAEWAKQRLGEDISQMTAEEISNEFSAEEISWLILEGVL